MTSPQIIDDLRVLQAFLEGLPDCEGPEPSLYMDLEGHNLGREGGSTSIITVLVEPRHTVHLIQVSALGEQAFTITNSAGNSLKSILESPTMKKVFFDIRSDSSALFRQFGISVQGIDDLQVINCASRSVLCEWIGANPFRLAGLNYCIRRDASLSNAQYQTVENIENAGKALWKPDLGGTFATFDERPLSSGIVNYCANDVVHMPKLRRVYRSHIWDSWWEKIVEETHTRIEYSQSPYFGRDGKHMGQGPKDWHSLCETGFYTRSLFTEPGDAPSARMEKCLFESQTLADQQPDLDRDNLPHGLAVERPIRSPPMLPMETWMPCHPDYRPDPKPAWEQDSEDEDWIEQSPLFPTWLATHSPSLNLTWQYSTYWPHYQRGWQCYEPLGRFISKRCREETPRSTGIKALRGLRMQI